MVRLLKNLVSLLAACAVLSSCNLVDDGLRGSFVIGSNSGAQDSIPLNVLSASFKSLPNGASTTVSNPIVQVNVGAEFHDATFEVHQNEDCSSLIGSGTIQSDGAVEVSNISRSVDRFQADETWSFYGLVKQGSDFSECKSLGLSLDLWSNQQLVYATLTDAYVNAAEDKAYIVDPSRSALFLENLSTGARTIISSSTVGSGPQFDIPSFIQVNVAESTAYVGDSGLDAVLAVDLATGTRTIISDASTGSPIDLVLYEVDLR